MMCICSPALCCADTVQGATKPYYNPRVRLRSVLSLPANVSAYVFALCGEQIVLCAALVGHYKALCKTPCDIELLDMLAANTT